ncbi:MAG: rod shape-determining protein MreD [Thiotrichaceae bacterium]
MGLGILQDVLSDTLLGQHALMLSLIAYISVISHTRVRTFPLWQQSVGIGVVVAINQLLHVWIHGMLGHPPRDWTFFYPALVSMILYWMFIILRDLRHQLSSVLKILTILILPAGSCAIDSIEA